MFSFDGKLKKIKKAIKEDDLSTLEEMLARGFDPDTHYSTKVRGNLLNFAAVEDCPKSMPILIKYGADLNYCDCEHYTPLMDAACRGHYICAEHLLKAGADYSIRNSAGSKAEGIARDKSERRVYNLITDHAALRRERQEAIKQEYIQSLGLKKEIKTKAIAKKTKQGNPKKLNKLIQAQDCEELERLFNAGISPDTIVEKDSHVTCLHQAVWHGKADAVKTILNYDLDPLHKSAGGNTVLVNAVRQGHYDISKMILAVYPDIINEAGLEGYSPLFVAVDAENYRLVELLLDNGANIEQCSDQGLNIFDTSAYKSNEKIQKLVAEKRPETQKSVPKVAEPEREHQTGTSEKWRKLNDHEISYTEQKAQFNITHIFNFEAGECLMVVENPKTGGQSHSSSSFKQVANQNLISDAQNKLVELGGDVSLRRQVSPASLTFSKKQKV